VLPIGGLKEKALAAQRNKIPCVIAPAENEPDIEDIPEHLRKKLTFHFVSHIDEVLEIALEREDGRSNGRVARTGRPATAGVSSRQP
jgi:ATP-dependent Lon protease